MNYIEPAGKSFRKTILALFLGSFVTFADLYSTQPVIPVFAKQFGVSPAMASLTLSFATGTLALCLLLVSFFSENIDRKKIMGTALTLSALLSICVSFIQDDLYILIAIRAIQGAVLAGFPAIAMAYINEEFHPKSLGYVMGIYVSGSSIGGLAGRLIVGVLTDHFSWNIAIGSLGALSLIISLAFWWMLPPSQHAVRVRVSLSRIKTSLINNLRNNRLVLLFGMAFLLMGSFVTVYNFVGIPLMGPPYHLSQTLIGFIFIIYLVGTFSSTWMGKLADQYGRSVVLLIGIAIMLMGALLTLLDPLLLKIMGLALFTFGFFGAHSIASSWVGSLADKSEKAQASALYLLFYYAGSSIVGASGGLFLMKFGWGGVISAVSILILLAAACAMMVEKVKIVK
ncbi:MFS transporter [Peribacillus frigoritolerans]|uniref:MFS transporter n=1 Tax=Peribacillus TaxID=2675229 RepID=UPI0007BFE1AD|nr:MULTISPECIES: MFS transporter [Peribacillus]MBD8136974.1 MFS transporter [Bacillus sp. CFBP 13597]MDP9738668.1 YNFM family putative membrane transporter [Bacillus sp. B2I3]PEF37158.1 MFS transporter [Bacillus sp. AFS094228]PEO48624.1 MFS transporter [Bacillus sp. AFS026049]PHD76366.1 MFS transporter [Bacillus sp. AFS043905]QNK49248.1 MFS transporter [Brevibacterium sp. PAMC23299]